MNKKMIIPGKPGGKNENMASLLKKLGGNELLTDSLTKRWPVDLHEKIHSVIDDLQFCIRTKEGKKVTNRMVLTEALLDLFNKYEKASHGENVSIDYVFKEGKKFNVDL
jgi:hypothetical protein